MSELQRYVIKIIKIQNEKKTSRGQLGWQFWADPLLILEGSTILFYVQNSTVYLKILALTKLRKNEWVLYSQPRTFSYFVCKIIKKLTTKMDFGY